MPYDAEDLPELGSSPPSRWLPSIRDIKNYKILQGEFPGGSYELTPKQALIQAQIEEAMIRAQMKPNGNWNIRAARPLLGGDLTFDVNSNQGNTNYMLQYQRKF